MNNLIALGSIIGLGLLTKNKGVVDKMNFKEMSKALYKSNMVSHGIILATKTANLFPSTTVDQNKIDNYQPFTRFYIENRNSTITLRVDIQGQALGDDTIQGSIRSFNLLPGTWVEFEPEDNLKFSMIAVKNTHAATDTVAGDIVYSVANY